MSLEFINEVKEALKSCGCDTVSLEASINKLYMFPCFSNCVDLAAALTVLILPTGVNLLKYCEGLRERKQKEYAGISKDRFRNFRPVFGFEAGKSKSDILLGYAAKHAKSLLQIINCLEEQPPKIWVEKAADLFTYCWILTELNAEGD